MQFGTAAVKITPTMPVTLSGYFNVRMWDRVLDDLYAQALVLRDPRTGVSLTLVVLDLVGVPEALVARVRERLPDVPNLLITCTHTHTAPAVELKEEGSSAAFLDFLVERIVAAVREASARMQPADEIRFARENDHRFAFCRRWWTRSGRVVTNPPRRYPELLGPEGPIDPDIPVLSIWANGRARVVLANIVNHTDVIGGTGVSGDWPGLMRDALRRRIHDDETLVMPLIGTSGDIAHVDAWSDEDRFSYEWSRRIANGYAESIAAALKCSTRQKPSLTLAHTTFTTGPRELSDDQIAAAKTIAAEHKGAFQPGDLTAFDFAKRTPAALKYFADALLKVAADRRTREYEVFAVEIGETTLVSLPGEPFSAYGVKIKRELLEDRPAIVVTHGNGLCDYIPMSHHYANGGYETESAVSWLSTSTGETMMAAVERALKDLRRKE